MKFELRDIPNVISFGRVLLTIPVVLALLEREFGWALVLFALAGAKEYVSNEAMGPDGYLNERGLVVLPDEKLKQMQDAAKDGKKMAAPTS